MPEPLSPRRRQMMDAALRVVAQQGLRGLTHRAVDREAGLPEGSCSAYYRTRRALVGGLAEHVAASLADDVAALAEALRGCAGEDERANGLTAALFLRWLEEPDLLLARTELALEAARDADLAAVLGAWRRRLVEVVDAMMADRGKEHGDGRAELLVAASDGILMSALARPAAARRPFVEQSLGLLMDALDAARV